jgi:hypothetical protein
MASAKETKEPKGSEKVPPGQTKKKGANPLPYIIIFAILFLVALGVLTWALSVFYKASQCNLDPNIWCSDNWTCQTACPSTDPNDPNTCYTPLAPNGAGPVDPCFCKNISPDGGVTGMAGCINTQINNYCTAESCACPDPIAGANNCLNGCPNTLGKVNPSECTTLA